MIVYIRSRLKYCRAAPPLAFGEKIREKYCRSVDSFETYVEKLQKFHSIDPSFFSNLRLILDGIIKESVRASGRGSYGQNEPSRTSLCREKERENGRVYSFYGWLYV